MFYRHIKILVGLEQAWLKYDVKKIFSDGDYVVVFNDVVTSPTTLFACGLYHVEVQKIRSLKQLYDP
jgi:hypothetical protein